MLRQPAVAGRFYPDEPDQLKAMIRGFVDPIDNRVTAIGTVVPHAGYMYSGHVAGALYSRIQIPDRVILLGPNHTGRGARLSIPLTGSWQTPLGVLQIDEELCSMLLTADSNLEEDTSAHRFEHALEVQIPFLQYAGGSSIQFAPIVLGTGDWNDLETLGIAIAAVLSKIGRGALIIASSDMNHYESDSITRIKDRMAIDRILGLDAKGLHEIVRKERISMCGFGPAVVMLVAGKRLGASEATLVKYATSADVSGDVDRVVGYAGIVVR
jgi:AmmeMemoRadiSam system protein B